MDRQGSENMRSRSGGGPAPAFLRGAALGIVVVSVGAVAVGLSLPPSALPRQPLGIGADRAIPIKERSAEVSSAEPAPAVAHAESEPSPPQSLSEGVPPEEPAPETPPELPAAEREGSVATERVIPAAPVEEPLEPEIAGLGEAPGPDDQGTEPAPETPAVLDNAEDVIPPDREPLLSVILVRAERLSEEHLAALPIPITVAIRSDAPRAAEAATAARSAGHEVVADLPPPGMAALSGSGLAWVDVGGASVQDAADRLDMPHAGGDAMVSADAAPAEIRRAIERAAGRARATGGAVLVMEASAQALDSLIRWGMENPGAVWFAPLSAVIRAGRAGSADAGVPD